MLITGISAIVTGAASGLGAATCAALVSGGASVVGIDLAAGWEKAGRAPDGVTPISGDVREPEDVAAAVEAAVGSGSPLRLAVNCAGIGPSARILSRKGVHDLETYSRVISINLVGTFNVLRLAAEAIAATDPDDQGARGLIVNTASIAAFDGQIGQIAYAASKGGVAAMTLPAARDLAQHGIRVMTVAPGILDTPMLATVSDEFRAGLTANIPFPHRLGRSDEYASLVLSIAAQDYLNGEVIRMDGALRMPPR